MKQNERNYQNQKIIKMHEQKPLLKSLEIERLISIISPEQIKEAQVILKEYLEGFKHLEEEKKIVLAYLIGELQGFDNFYNKEAGKSIADKVTEIYQTAFRYGYLLSTLHYPRGKKKDAQPK